MIEIPGATTAPPPLELAPDPAETQERTPCPFCAEPILPAAVKCKHCGGRLDGTAPQRPRTRRTRRAAVAADPGPDAGDYVLCVLCPGIACIFSIIALARGQHRRGAIMLGLSVGMNVLWGMIRVLMLDEPRPMR